MQGCMGPWLWTKPRPTPTLTAPPLSLGQAPSVPLEQMFIPAFHPHGVLAPNIPPSPSCPSQPPGPLHGAVLHRSWPCCLIPALPACGLLCAPGAVTSQLREMRACLPSRTAIMGRQPLSFRHKVTRRSHLAQLSKPSWSQRLPQIPFLALSPLHPSPNSVTCLIHLSVSHHPPTPAYTWYRADTQIF